ncbi:MAG: hypothetical protein A3D96_02130 [Chlamydiae bacterium RIFCSPHIGHO2_12_FULL_44_59]|nr:MAG: hypothetical protein A2796_04820 [Chlamydiae bacterium RIFCSPHIGHO2_01_FULL_44_39]OGN58667.1 MAG: hypothetical protein A3C42_04030 [Chlamydiae bacterium RIFCSPHIGHO2_02_FULL_45_9]OGN60705.1 MAG: hypothetical protein A3D96_02130 [Chlamydiae bacterium RIFCSPHIGHO2_12_FULL_44_59]OGN66965.1 MAG: hypothetical protein A2978_02360 [Chlamydiae bacterium RIFCSPLOWO2_01_FULL_44_52]OGN67516.1 MAG: hypothetical protein A3I67_03575 [Chlamydiae bacterium RIFCSPLOWO2_02_FULL_45_22]OGN71218.1 MAG: hyp
MKKRQNLNYVKGLFLILWFSTLHASLYPLDCAFLPDAGQCKSHDTGSPSNFFASLDFLYWEGMERGLEYALKNTASSLDQKIEVFEPDFGFHPAFRVGLGTHLGDDEWGVRFFYTRYYTANNAHTAHLFNGNDQSGIRSVWTSPSAFQGNSFRSYWQHSNADWKLHTHVVDLFLQHGFCISPRISLDPGFGLTFAIIQQRLDVLYEEGNRAFAVDGSGTPIQFISSQIAMKNRSFNLGMGAKMNVKWNFSEPFDCIGSLSGSLLASQFTVGRNEWDVSSDPMHGVLLESFRENDDYWTLRPAASLLLGFGWNGCICKPKHVVYYSVSAAYELHVFWKQNMLLRFIDQANAAMIVPSLGDLFFHGLTLQGLIDF